MNKNFFNSTDRRFFLKTCGLSLLTSMVPAQLSHIMPTKKKLGKMICATPQSANHIGGEGFNIAHNFFYVYDLDTKEHYEFEIPIGLAHSTVEDPIRPHHAMVIEREGPYACLVDYIGCHAAHKISATEGFYFTGNALYSVDGKEVYLGEAAVDGVEPGHILVLNSSDFSVKERFLSGGVSPYGLKWLDESNLVISHFGQPRAFFRSNERNVIAIFNTKQKAITRTIESPQEHIYLANMEVAGGKIFALTHDTLRNQGEFFDEIGLIKRDYKRWVLERPLFKDIEAHESPLLVVDLNSEDGEIVKSYVSDGYKWGLSLTLNPATNVIAGTHGLGQTVSFQDALTGKVVHEHHFESESPRAVTLTKDLGHFVVTTDAGAIHYFNAETFQHETVENPVQGRYDFVVNAICV